MTSSSCDPLARTRLAILRTMGSLHAEPLQYDLESLRALILSLAPDLLCADITPEMWEGGDLGKAPLEVREALAPAVSLSDTVLVPVAPTAEQFGDYQAPPGWRQRLARRFERLLRWGQRKANGPQAVHGLGFQAFCHTVCALEQMTWRPKDRRAFQARNRALAENILRAVRRDPGGRVLVAVQCQWHHTLEPLLKRGTVRLEIVDYREL